MATQQTKGKALWGVVIALALIGLGLSIHLTYLHAKIYTDPNFKSSCAINAKINCESVALSKYAILFSVPVAVWGLLAYLLFLGVALLGLGHANASNNAKSNSDKPDHPSAAHGALFLMGLVAAAGSGYFAYVSHFKIGAMCPSCMGTYAVNPILFIVAIGLLRRDGYKASDAVGSFFQWLSSHGQVVFIAAFVVAVGLFAFPRYWQGAEPWKDRDVATGSDHGHHWIGAKDPRVLIIEYSDYQCPFCKIKHLQIRKTLRKYKNLLRIVHRHYPLDHHCHPKIKRRFHPKACLFSRAAYCAGKQGKFWRMNDSLYKDPKQLERPGLLTAAKAIGLNKDAFKKCLDSEGANDAIAKDLRDGMKVGVNGTPYLIVYVDGKKRKKTGISSKELTALLEDMKSGKLPRPKTSPRRRQPAAPAKRRKVTPATPKRAAAPRKAASKRVILKTIKTPAKPATLKPAAPLKRTTPVRTAPTKTAPTRTAPTKAAPAKTAPTKPAPTKAAPAKTPSAKAAPTRTPAPRR